MFEAAGIDPEVIPSSSSRREPAPESPQFVTVYVLGPTNSEPSTYEVGLYEPEDPPEQCVTYEPTGCAPVNAVAYPVSDDAYTAHDGSTDQSPATVDGEVE
jgi:hypothetical protein